MAGNGTRAARPLERIITRAARRTRSRRPVFDNISPSANARRLPNRWYLERATPYSRCGIASRVGDPKELFRSAHDPEDQFLTTYRLPLTQDGCQTGGTWSGQLPIRGAASLPAREIPRRTGRQRSVFAVVSTDKPGEIGRPPALESSF